MDVLSEYLTTFSTYVPHRFIIASALISPDYTDVLSLTVYSNDDLEWIMNYSINNFANLTNHSINNFANLTEDGKRLFIWSRDNGNIVEFNRNTMPEDFKVFNLSDSEYREVRKALIEFQLS